MEESGKVLSGVAQRLSQLEKRKGSRAALARASGIPETTLQMCVARGTDPSLRVLIAVARAAGVSVEWLATGQEASSQPRGGVNIHRLALAIANLEQVIEELGSRIKPISPEGKASIVAEQYDEWQRTGSEPDRKRLLSIVRKVS